MNAGESATIFDVVEKPEQDEAPSNLAIVGRYVLTPEIWPHLRTTQPGAGDEIQLTDAISELLKTGEVDAFCMQGKSHDCGDKLGYMKAFVEYGLRHKDYQHSFKAFIGSVDL